MLSRTGHFSWFVGMEVQGGHFKLKNKSNQVIKLCQEVTLGHISYKICTESNISLWRSLWDTYATLQHRHRRWEVFSWAEMSWDELFCGTHSLAIAWKLIGIFNKPLSLLNCVDCMGHMNGDHTYAFAICFQGLSCYKEQIKHDCVINDNNQIYW
jgi:hypothetical protein